MGAGGGLDGLFLGFVGDCGGLGHGDIGIVGSGVGIVGAVAFVVGAGGGAEARLRSLVGAGVGGGDAFVGAVALAVWWRGSLAALSSRMARAWASAAFVIGGVEVYFEGVDIAL